MHRAVRPYLGLKASLSSLPGWQELRIITLPPRFYSVHSFGYVAGRGGGRSPAFLPEQEFSSPRAAQAVTSHCPLPFPPSCLHPGVVARVGWGEATFFLPPSEALNGKGTFPGHAENGSGSSLAFPEAVGTGKLTEGKKKRIEWGNVFLRAVSISECVGSRFLRGLAFFHFLDVSGNGAAFIPSSVLEGRKELFRGYLWSS